MNDYERLAALTQGADSKPDGYVSISVIDFRWLIKLAEPMLTATLIADADTLIDPIDSEPLITGSV